MASKVVHQIQLNAVKNISTGKVSGSCRALCFSPDIGASFNVELTIDGDGLTELLNSTEAALKENLAEGGHTVTDADPPPPPESEDETES